MKPKPDSIPETFRELRKLPLEVNFAQVKQWVLHAPRIDYYASNDVGVRFWLKKLFKNHPRN